MFLLTIVTNKSNLFQIALMKWAKITLLEFFRRIYFRIFFGLILVNIKLMFPLN